jgi:23S rRNA (pseudouridine1915-N3)-methyltransferase
MKIITIGKKHEDWVLPGIERYQKRLKAGFLVEWVLLPHSSLQGASARQEESQRILSRLKPDDFVVLLDERGASYTSPALSELLTTHLAHGKHLVFIIGGAYGVDASLHTRAQCTWSLSPLVFPHQLVRLVLIEQLYRAQQIAAGSAYHHS